MAITYANPMTEFEDKKLLVTGGTKGMGEKIAQRFAAAGATVLTTARSIPAELADPNLFVQADISTPEGVEKVIEAVKERFGTIDILVNNVGALIRLQVVHWK
ncbi:NAD(P)-dependent dehydrogenase (short-subunit alcohol dehydrogenase family) [Paenibacillus brasilensis]|uniref:NAD(P)-dependent dehydrogenase (Short-subunit alcohol dehydrogenase family) n=1 Tax=Paenibacillus brasilensis TaxID=128574 RepID=A0ABU0KUV2_9BACL|nr:NAD(P)-dependent dehydrogenase (short-subunit alcohol dehydrogenase family) [Paenibacillus brasilensis]